MKMLSKESFNQVYKLIMDYSRSLEKSIFLRYLNIGSDQDVINELKKFQNDDGGFGHGIESDFRLPDSSPMATSVGLRLLSEVDTLDEAKQMIEAAIGYLETTYNKDRNGWFALPKEVNNFPHAFWWHYNEEDKMTMIDRNWGNPSAEIIAYIYKYKEYVKNLDVDHIVQYAIDYIENKKEFDSDNEIYCYIKLYSVLLEDLKNRLEARISLAIEQVIIYNEEEWPDYVPKPLDFVKDINSERFGILESKINNNLDFLINELEVNGKMIPPWGDSYYQDDLRDAYNEWIGVLTIKAIVSLDKFGRIEK